MKGKEWVKRVWSKQNEHPNKEHAKAKREKNHNATRQAMGCLYLGAS